MPSTDHRAPDRGLHALLGDPPWRALLAAGTPRAYRPGSFLLRQGAPGGFVLVLTEGRVKITVTGEDGDELLLALRGPGDLVGEMAARASTTRTATVQAIDGCTARHLPTEVFHRFLTERDAHGVFSDYLISKLSETVPYQVRLVHFGPRQRVAMLLLEIIALAGHDQSDPLRIPLSQEAVAGALGLARSTVAEQIAMLREERVLTRRGRLVVTDTKALARHAGIE